MKDLKEFTASAALELANKVERLPDALNAIKKAASDGERSCRVYSLSKSDINELERRGFNVLSVDETDQFGVVYNHAVIGW